MRGIRGRKKKRAKPRDLEGPLHRSILANLQAILPRGSLVHHSPNEVGASGKDIAIAVSKQGALGRAKGWPDLECVVRQNGQTIFFVIEVKHGTNDLTDDQRELRTKFRALGVPYCTARSVQDVIDFLEWEGIETMEKRS